MCGINFTLLFLSTITWRQLYLGSTQKMITRLPNEKWEPILGGTSSCTTFWLLCSCLSSIRRPRSLKNTFHHTYLPTNIYFQKISISVLWGALRKTYCIWIDKTEQSTYGSPQIIRRESDVVPYIQQADVISNFDTYVLCCFVLKVVEKWLKWRSSGTLED